MAKRITIIEDEADIVELVRYNFLKEGFEVRSFSRGKTGLEDLQRNPTDLIILDIMLPDLDGFDVCRRLRSHERLKAIPVIFLTAKVQAADRQMFMELGVQGLIAKPFDPMTLAASVGALLHWN